MSASLNEVQNCSQQKLLCSIFSLFFRYRQAVKLDIQCVFRTPPPPPHTHKTAPPPFFCLCQYDTDAAEGSVCFQSQSMWLFVFFLQTAQDKCTLQCEPVDAMAAESPVLTTRRRETQSNYLRCGRGACASLASHLPVISWSESFRGIVTIVCCNFVSPQTQASNKTDGLRRLCNAGPVYCLRLIRSDKNVTVCCACFCLCCVLLGKKWHKYGCTVLLLAA